MLSALLLSLGCSGGSGDDGGSDAPTNFCDSDTTAESFVAGMSHETSSGLTVAILSADPAPPAQGKNRWVLEVKDASGAPLPGAKVEVLCKMTHSTTFAHGCPTDVEITDGADGTYEAYPVIFNMPKHWQMTINVTAPSAGSGDAGAPMETALFEFCIP